MPLSTTLTATAGGTAIGTADYTFWWNCTDARTSVSTVIAVCGDPTNATFGAKFNSVDAATQAVSKAYATPGTYRAKVIIERGSAPPAEQRTSITVGSPPTLTAALSANPASGAPPLNTTLTATAGGTATGTVNYTFWWNCTDAGTSVSTVTAACGDPTNATFGAKFNSVNGATQAASTTYAAAGTYSAKIIIERGSAPPAEQRTSISVSSSLSSLKAIDPNPELLSSGQVVNDNDKLAVLGRDVVMAAADGVTRVLLRTSTGGSGTVQFTLDGGTSPADGGLAPVTGSGRAQSVTVPAVSTPQGYRAFVIYQVPDEFNRGGDALLKERPIRFKAHFIPASGSPVDSILDFRLERPPVVLLHGIWSNFGTWTLPLVNDGRFEVTLGDYSATHAAHFATNFNVPVALIDEALYHMRQEGGAVTQVDFAGHSMGGILARNHVGWPYYRRSRNFNAGDVHKLVTLNTPHTGSPLGNLLIGVRYSPVIGPLLTEAARLFDHAIDEGAIDDLANGSTALAAIGETAVPSHALIGTGGSDSLELAPAPLGYFYILVNYFASTSGLFQALQHDFIVGRDSQAGGIVVSAQTVFGGADSIHTNVTGSSSYSSRVADLWNTSASTSTFADFPAVASVAQMVAPMQLRTSVNATVASGLTITSPADGTTVAAGSTQTVEVTAQPGTGVTTVLLVGPGTAQVDVSAPFQFSVPIPTDAIGPFVIQAIGSDGSAHYFTSATLTLNVTTPAALNSVRLLPKDPILFGVSSTRQVILLGSFFDGVTRDLTSPALGTTYQISEPLIATVSASGLLTAKKLGVTTLVAANGGTQDSVSVTVAPPEFANGDANGDDSVTAADVFYLINTLFAGGPGAVGAGDVNGDGQVTPADVFYLINYLFAGGVAPAN